MEKDTDHEKLCLILSTFLLWVRCGAARPYRFYYGPVMFGHALGWIELAESVMKMAFERGLVIVVSCHHVIPEWQCSLGV